LARNLVIAVLGGMFSMWVTFSSGYLAVYQTVLLLMVGIPIYSFLKARRERLGMVEAPLEVPSDLSTMDMS
jgi:APA family basic amino acid/polyamine antiporter